MIAAERTALVLLAAGLSRRFGDVDKLAQDYLGRPLALHVTTAFESVPFLSRTAIVSGTSIDFTSIGYRVVTNADPSLGMARSVALGAGVATDAKADAVVIALADMPLVTANHVFRLFESARGDMAVVASSDGVTPRPPALFGSGRFDELMRLAGDEGARKLIRAGRHVIAMPGELIDIDTPEDLTALRARVA